MNCPRCEWPHISRRIANGVERRYCLHVDCDWSETVPVPRQKRAHRELPGGDTGRLQEVLNWAKELGW